MKDFEKYSRRSRSGSSSFTQRTKGNRLLPWMSIALAVLEEDALGPGKFLPDAHQVGVREGEVEVARQAVRRARNTWLRRP